MMNNNVRFMKNAISQRNRSETIFRSGKNEERRDETESGKPRKEITGKSNQGEMY